MTRTMFNGCKVIVFAVICEQNRIFCNYNDVNREIKQVLQSEQRGCLTCKYFSKMKSETLEKSNDNIREKEESSPSSIMGEAEKEGKIYKIVRTSF